ncbi:serine hydrolase domain-containing protein [Limnovirga soli]|nr:serine hydrolase domain-containing protein [Limnovirga soli]
MYFNIRRQIMGLFFILACLPVCLYAQVITPVSQSKAIDYTRLARIDSMVNDYVQHNWIKGAVTIIVKDNQLVQYKGYGMADAATNKPMEKDAIFRIASQTKAITSAGILILYEQGKLQLDEQVGDFIPEFKQQNVLNTFNAVDTTYTTVPAKRPITIRDLLTHTSGLDYPGIGSENMKAIYAKAKLAPGFGITKDASLLQKMKQLGNLPLVHQPGEQWTYGLNCDVLGCIIEIVSGMSLQDFLTKEIFTPLGMKDTYFNVPAAKASRLTTVYTEDSTHQIIPWPTGNFNTDPNFPLQNKTYFSGGADLSSTGYDYAVFLQMIMNGGIYNGKRILSPRTVEAMLTPQLDFLFNDTNNFGLGFEIVAEKGARKGTRHKGTFGWGGFFGSTYWADPRSKLIAIILTQQSPNSHYQVMEKFESMVYSSLK